MGALVDFYNLPIDFYPETGIEVPEKESLFKLFKKYNIDKKTTNILRGLGCPTLVNTFTV